MTAEVLMKNIYTFANILSQAESDIVARWNPTSLQNALNWADYCIKVYNQVADKPYRCQIEKQMAAMTLHLHPPSCLQLCVEDLGKARLIMEKTLLQNTHLPEKLFTMILKQQEKSNADNLTQDGCEKAAREVNNVTKLLQALQTNEESLGQIKLTSEATALLSTLMGLTECSSKPQRFETYVCNLLTRIAKKAGKFDVILKMLTVSPCDTTYTDSQLHYLHSIIIRWLSVPSNDTFLDSCKEVIQEACKFHTDFCHTYLKHILQWAKNMEPSYDEGDSNPYSWRFRSIDPQRRGGDRGRTLESLCEHIINLINVNKQCQILVKETLQTQKESSHFNVYRDIVKKIGHTAE
ncbi:uncharacterized protein LOC133172884 [Saccostrea echinata]|uniref:uncharacterized protein LOC133172884 n=1 Tax=Saccostrea echinata TaxID=191078 RepID=UPI002A7EE62B|nr:uncharacterized protein LOC133172884 [Saccostrea echinata]